MLGADIETYRQKFFRIFWPNRNIVKYVDTRCCLRLPLQTGITMKRYIGVPRSRPEPDSSDSSDSWSSTVPHSSWIGGSKAGKCNGKMFQIMTPMNVAICRVISWISNNNVLLRSKQTKTWKGADHLGLLFDGHTSRRKIATWQHSSCNVQTYVHMYICETTWSYGKIIIRFCRCYKASNILREWHNARSQKSDTMPTLNLMPRSFKAMSAVGHECHSRVQQTNTSFWGATIFT
jgi:hypothetical protein